MLMGCLLKPTSGRVYIGDAELSQLNEKQLPFIRRKYLGYVFQSFNLFPALTALENVEAVLNIKRTFGAQARSRAAGLLERVGLGGRLHHLPEDLSGGEKQRVAIARALAGDPPILLVDEPTGQLDSKTGQAVVTMLKQLAVAQNRLVFMVSHDNRILHAADHVLWMQDGKLMDNDPSQTGQLS
jgi:putative ABC transport system ATP-binding protein